MEEAGTNSDGREGTDRPTTPAGGGSRWPPRRRWQLAAVVTAATALVAAMVVALSDRDGDDETAATQGSTTMSAPESTTTTESEAPTTTAAPTTQPEVPAGPSAADTLEGFFSAAATTDEQLHTAADAINGAGPPWPSISEQVASTVRAAEFTPVAETIPAGLPHDLLQSVILVYSDLVSRRAAMESFASARAPGEPQYGDLLAELGNGHAAAERFEADLAAARSLAAAQPPVTIAAPDSRATAELQLLLDYVVGAHAGCGGSGGAVITRLPSITWDSDTSGTISGDPGAPTFDATLGPDGHWTTSINAC